MKKIVLLFSIILSGFLSVKSQGIAFIKFDKSNQKIGCYYLVGLIKEMEKQIDPMDPLQSAIGLYKHDLRENQKEKYESRSFDFVIVGKDKNDQAAVRINFWCSKDGQIIRIKQLLIGNKIVEDEDDHQLNEYLSVYLVRQQSGAFGSNNGEDKEYYYWFDQTDDLNSAPTNVLWLEEFIRTRLKYCSEPTCNQPFDLAEVLP
jgi:hypothetical protein